MSFSHLLNACNTCFASKMGLWPASHLSFAPQVKSSKEECSLLCIKLHVYMKCFLIKNSLRSFFKDDISLRWKYNLSASVRKSNVHWAHQMTLPYSLHPFLTCFIAFLSFYLHRSHLHCIYCPLRSLIRNTFLADVHPDEHQFFFLDRFCLVFVLYHCKIKWLIDSIPCERQCCIGCIIYFINRSNKWRIWCNNNDVIAGSCFWAMFQDTTHNW